MSRRRLLAAGIAVVAIVLVATGGAVTLVEGDTAQNDDEIGELAAEADQERAAMATAVEVAGGILEPLGFGVALGLGVGLLGGTTYAYKNRGMR